MKILQHLVSLFSARVFLELYFAKVPFCEITLTKLKKKKIAHFKIKFVECRENMVANPDILQKTLPLYRQNNFKQSFAVKLSKIC